jgi:hypothetical protein
MSNHDIATAARVLADAIHAEVGPTSTMQDYFCRLAAAAQSACTPDVSDAATHALLQILAGGYDRAANDTHTNTVGVSVGDVQASRQAARRDFGLS